MARVIMVRHGETDWSREARWQGHSDVPLNALGFEQADRLVKPLAKQQPTHIVTSDLVRTQQTIRPLAELLGLPITTDADLREIDVGSWAGLTHDEAAAPAPAHLAIAGPATPPARALVYGKRKPTPTFRRGRCLSRLRAVVGEAVRNGRDRVLL